MSWQPIETAPKDGTRILCCGPGLAPCFLEWKTNLRIANGRKRGEDWGNAADSYFGDPCEDDDYDLAMPGNGPTHWHPLDPPPGPSA